MPGLVKWVLQTKRVVGTMSDSLSVLCRFESVCCRCWTAPQITVLSGRKQSVLWTVS